MADDHGHLIDGTVRASQWRRSKSKAPPTPDGEQVRADAPRSIAGSLLVPAEMLGDVLSAGVDVDGRQDGRAGPPDAVAEVKETAGGDGRSENPEDTPGPPDAVAAVKETVGGDGRSGNPFLLPGAAQDQRVRPPRRWATRPVLWSWRAASALLGVGAVISIALIVGGGQGASHALGVRASTAASGAPTESFDWTLGPTLASIPTALRVLARHSAATAGRRHRSRPAARSDARPRHDARRAGGHVSQTRRRTVARPSSPAPAPATPAPSVPSYTPTPAVASSAGGSSAASQTSATGSNSSAGPTNAGPLGGIGSCVKGC
ncbi:MAG: hypothetical protein ACYDHH_33535 [Solirubrobacteraceae bacterium]